MDRAVAAELDSLAWTVRASWSREDAHDVERQLFGQEISTDWVAEKGPIRAFDAEREQQLFKLRAQLFETREETTGLAHQELGIVDKG